MRPQRALRSVLRRSAGAGSGRTVPTGGKCAGQGLARISSVQTSAERTAGTTGCEDLAVLAPAAAAALGLLEDAVRRGGADHDDIVQTFKAAGVHEAFAGVFDAASERVKDTADDPYDFDVRLHADNLAGAASDVRRAFEWL